jgi:hypothetical protein
MADARTDARPFPGALLPSEAAAQVSEPLQLLSLVSARLAVPLASVGEQVAVGWCESSLGRIMWP